MKTTLRRRLERLEVSTRRLVAMTAPYPSMAPVIDQCLQAWKIERGENESRAEAFARALGMTPRQLRETIEEHLAATQR